MSQKDRRSDWLIFALRTFAIAGFIVSAWSLFGDSSTSARTDQRGPAVTPARSQASPGYITKPIEELRVGDRVYAHNPEVDDAERSTWAEPDCKDWLHLSLVMPKEDGSELKIELLRPESWVLEQVSYIAKERETDLVSTSTVSDKALAVGEFAGESTPPQPAASALPLTGGTQPSSAADETTKHISTFDGPFFFPIGRPYVKNSHHAELETCNCSGWNVFLYCGDRWTTPDF